MDRMLGRNEGSESRDFTDGRRYGEDQHFFDEEFIDTDRDDRNYTGRNHRTQASRNNPRSEDETRFRRERSSRNYDYNVDDGENIAFRDREMSRPRFDRNDSFATGDFRRGLETQRSGGFFGKGPKGWKRSDERIKEEVSEALYRDYHVDASEIEVEVKDGVVTLSGTVDSRQAKRSAEECIENLTGVSDVHNRIRIQDNSNVANLRNNDSGEKRALS
jgi:hypothetical protein